MLVFIVLKTLCRSKRQVKHKADPSIIEYSMDECLVGMATCMHNDKRSAL